MRGTAAAAAGVFTVMRTISEPARASSAICLAVLAGSSVSVLVIDCTTMGAPPPTITFPTRTPTLRRRGAGPVGRGGWGTESLIDVGLGGRAALAAAMHKNTTREGRAFSALSASRRGLGEGRGSRGAPLRWCFCLSLLRGLPATGLACGGLPIACRRSGHFSLLARRKVTKKRPPA